MDDLFIKRIHMKEKEEDIWDKIKQSKLPLVMWGCGDVAKAVLNLLKINKMSLAGIFVDSLDEKFIWQGYEVNGLSDLLKQYEECNLILGHSSYQRGEELAKQYPKFKNVFCIPSVFYNQYSNITKEFIKENSNLYEKTYELLEDDFSRKCMVAYLNARMLGKVEYIYPCCKKENSFFQNEIYSVGGEETYLDIGAYNGDTIQQFLIDSNGRYKEIVAFEPGEENFEELTKYVEKNKIKEITCIQKGTWKEKDTLYFGSNDKSFSITKQGQTDCCQVDSLDHFSLLEPKIRNVTMLKINFYAGVLETLQGAQSLIREKTPKLAIVVGFDEYALIHIPQYLKKIVPEYKCFLRFNRSMPACLTLYAKI